MSGQFPGNFGPGQGMPRYGAPPGPQMTGAQPQGQPSMFNGPPGKKKPLPYNIMLIV